MSNYNWCHGPECHTYTTSSRVRGSKGNKVLRTIKIKETKWNEGNIYRYFCNQNCLHGFLTHHLQSIIAIAPRREPLETKIKDPVKETTTTPYGYTYSNTRITKVDNA